MADPRRLERQLAELRHGHHVCSLYEQPAEALGVAARFLALGLARGEACLYVTGEHSSAGVTAALAAVDVDVPRELERGSLTLCPTFDVTFSPGQFDPESILSLYRQAVTQALAHGFTGLRVATDLTLAFAMNVDHTQVMQWEALLNRLFGVSPLVGLCQYRRDRFRSRTLQDALLTHPLVLTGDEVCPNLYYEPTELFLAPRATQQRVNWMLAQLMRDHAAERGLVAAEERFRTLTEAIPITIYETDLDGQWTYVNTGWETVSGLNVSESLGNGWRRALNPTDLATWSHMVHRVLHGRQEEPRAIRVSRPDGTERWVRLRMAARRSPEVGVTGLVGTMADITEQIRATAAIQGSEARLAEAERLAEMGNWTWHIEDDTASWSDGLYRIFGLTRAEFTPSYEGYLQCVLPEDRVSVGQHVGHALATRGALEYVCRIVRSDGAVRFVESRAIVICDPENRPIEVVGTLQDVTDRKRVEDQRRQIAMDLHDDLVQSLYAVTLGLETLIRSVDGGAEGIRQALQHSRIQLSELISRVRTYIQELRLQSHPAGDLYSGLQQIARDLCASSHLETDLQWPRSFAAALTLPKVADLVAIAREAASNVIRHAAASSIVIRVTEEAGQVRLTIRDDGCGFDTRGTRNQPGEGLSNMAERAARIGGHLMITSEIGHGTVVDVTAPVVQEPRR